MICDIIHKDNLEYMGSMADGQLSLVYIDPPFNTGKSQRYTRIQTEHDDNGDRVGYQGKKYRTVKLGTMAALKNGRNVILIDNNIDAINVMNNRLVKYVGDAK